MKNKQIVEKILKYTAKILDYTKNTEYNDFINNSILVYFFSSELWCKYYVILTSVTRMRCMPYFIGIFL